MTQFERQLLLRALLKKADAANLDTQIRRRVLLRELLKEAAAELDVPTLKEYMESLRAERPYAEQMRRLVPLMVKIPLFGGLVAALRGQIMPLIASGIITGGVGLWGLMKAYQRQQAIAEQLSHPSRVRQVLAAIHAQNA